MTHDFTTPEGRAAAIEALGVDGYNRALADHHRASVIKVVGGHELRRVYAGFGALIMVGATRTAFVTLAQAEAYALAHRIDIEEGTS